MNQIIQFASDQFQGIAGRSNVEVVFPKIQQGDLVYTAFHKNIPADNYSDSSACL